MNYLVIAESTGVAGIQEALTTAFTDVSTNVMSTITNVLPVALGIVGAVMVVTIGIKIFKRFSAKA